MDAVGEKLFEVTMDSGEKLLVQRLSPYARIAILDEAERIYPMPDPTPFQKIIPNTPAGVTLKTPPEDDPQYKLLVTAVNTKRNNYYLESVIIASVVDVIGGREAAVARYAEQIAALRRRASLGELYNDWQATVLFGMVRVPADTTKIVAVAGNAFALEEGEIRDGIACFRYQVQQYSAVGHSGQESTPGAATPVG